MKELISHLIICNPPGEVIVRFVQNWNTCINIVSYFANVSCIAFLTFGSSEALYNLSLKFVISRCKP